VTTFDVTLNGSNRNPYERYGLERNPFPALPDASIHPSVNGCLADLAARPIVDAADLRQRLTAAGASTEFVEGCVARFQPGRTVRFTVSFPDQEVTE
jgi:hypothetical protein